MDTVITGNGTVSFFLKPGHHRYEVSGTLASGATIKLMAGPSTDGSGHVQVKDADGADIIHTDSSTPAPQILWGGGWYSVLVENFGASSNVVVHANVAR